MRVVGWRCAADGRSRKGAWASCQRAPPAEQFRRAPVGPVDGQRAQLSLPPAASSSSGVSGATRIIPPHSAHALKRTEPRLGWVEGLIGRWISLPEVIERIAGGTDAASAPGQPAVHLELSGDARPKAVLAMPLRRAHQPGAGGLRKERRTGQERERLRHLLERPQSLLRRDGGRFSGA